MRYSLESFFATFKTTSLRRLSCAKTILYYEHLLAQLTSD